ncbi:MAG: TonB-dependent receptor [Acidobacteria bacterium]|nr:TonB-dependent receptor [Acidobacteriota bacterium]
MRSGILTLLTAAALAGQTAQITGKVEDPTGAAVPQADVKVAHTGTGIVSSVRTNAEGQYVVPLLQPGDYRIVAQKEGFRTLTRSGIRLQVDQVARVDLKLEVGSITESVQVTAEASPVDQETSALGQVIGNKQIVEMPVNGRNILSLVRLAAGVTPLNGENAGFTETGNFNVSNITVSGGRGSMNSLMLDGANNTAPTREEIAVSPSIDAVQEFKVYTNGAPAEFGRTTGGVVSVITKSGTNELHGAAFEFLRNDKLDARNPFATVRPPFRYNQYGASAGGPIVLPKLYNGRNRTFFFFTYEGWRYIDYANSILTVPTASQRAGDFSQTRQAAGALIPIFDPASTASNPAGAGFVRDPFPGNLFPSSRMDRIATQIMAAVPLPNRTPASAVTNIQNYAEQRRRATFNDQWLGRFDHNLTDKHRLSYRLGYNLNRVTPESQFGNFLTAGEGNDVFTRNYQQTVASWTWTASPATYSEFRAGYVLTSIDRAPPTAGGADMDRLGYPRILPRRNFPSHVIADFTELGGGQHVDGGVSTLSAHETVTHVRGRHTLKFGGEVWALRNNRYQFGALSGAFNFNRDLTNNPQAPQASGYGVATFLLGAVNAGNVTVGDKRYERAKYAAGFAQDDWRVSGRLTLNLGIRYDFETNPIDRYDRKSNFNFTRVNPAVNLPGVLEFSGVDFQGTPVRGDYNNWGPRFGFAFTADRSARSVLRGSYGILYQGNFETFESNLGWSATTQWANPSIGPRPSFYLSQGPSAISLPPGNTDGPRSFLGAAVSGRQSGDRIGYIQQWSFGLQRAFGRAWTVEAVYVGSKGTRLSVGGGNFDANQLPPQYLSLGFSLQDQVTNPLFDRGVFGRTVARQQVLRPFPAYQGVTYLAPRWGSSIYHGLELNLRRRLSHGLQVELVYTKSKLIDDLQSSLSGFTGFQTAIGGAQSAYNRRAERSINGADVSQRAVVNYLWELPFGRGRKWIASGPLDWIVGGWQVAGLTTLTTGQPLAVRGANNNAANRPNSAGRSAKLDDSLRTVNRWFDTSAFTGPPLFTFGNVGRVLPDVRAAGIVSFDAGIHKFFTFREKARLQVRGEAFNVFNHVNLGPPNLNFVSTAFGVIGSTSTPPRLLQVGAKVIF